MKSIAITLLTVATLLGATQFALAQDVPLVSGQIKKLNPDAEKITIKHDPIPNLDMGKMTMVFKAKDPEMLKMVKPGDKVKFTAERVNGRITITKIEKTK